MVFDQVVANGNQHFDDWDLAVIADIGNFDFNHRHRCLLSLGGLCWSASLSQQYAPHVGEYLAEISGEVCGQGTINDAVIVA